MLLLVKYPWLTENEQRIERLLHILSPYIHMSV